MANHREHFAYRKKACIKLYMPSIYVFTLNMHTQAAMPKKKEEEKLCRYMQATVVAYKSEYMQTHFMCEIISTSEILCFLVDLK